MIDSIKEKINEQDNNFEFDNTAQSVQSIIGGSNMQGSLSNIAAQFSEENQQKLTDIVFAKLT